MNECEVVDDAEDEVEPETELVRARDLRPGDVLIGSMGKRVTIVAVDVGHVRLSSGQVMGSAARTWHCRETTTYRRII